MSSPPSSPQPERIRYRRILESVDPERIRALVKATGVFTAEEVRVAGDLADTTLDGSETYRWLIAERDGTLVGYTCFDRIPLASISFDLFWIAVHPSMQGTGLARELMERTASFVRGKRGHSIYAETSSTELYARTRAFYLKAGFTEVARIEDFYKIGDAKIIFRLVL
jgi:ribosomal protein S18 acetylase RimI-like enzyme